MPDYVNTSYSPLGIPGVDGIVAPGDTVKISAEAAKNVGVAQFIEDGWLTKGRSDAKAED